MTGSDPQPARGRRVAAFVRHGHFDRPEATASAQSLYPLSAQGRIQAAEAAGPILELILGIVDTVEYKTQKKG